jgi:hypothetical protein
MKKFSTSLHFTSLHFTSLHFTSLHFTASAESWPIARHLSRPVCLQRRWRRS